MAVTARVLSDGSVSVTDGTMTYPPLSPEAVQAIAARADISAAASKTKAITDSLSELALLITAAAPIAGSAAYAQVTVVPGQATAVLDDASFQLVQDNMPGQQDSSGNWIVGPLTVSPRVSDPAPTPAVDGTA